MAEVSSETIVPVQTEEVDFTFGSPAPEGDVEDDFDFDLGDGKLLEPLTETEESIQIEIAEDSQSHTAQADDDDEIGYEGGGVPVGDENGDGDGDEYTPKEAGHEATDEIDYDEVDLKITAPDADHKAADGKEQDTAEETHDAIDFGFETSGAVAGSSEHDDGADEDETEHPVHETGEMQVVDTKEEYDGAKGAEDDEEDVGEDAGGEEDDENEYDGDDDAEEMDSPEESLNAGLGQLHSPQAASTADVTVTWGNEICPLFKTSEVDSPDSFFLEDREAANYPLSRFLQTIRSGIASWVHTEDEIFIRIDDLGFEFGETTTEALLDQVTFHNLIALHNTLLTNDDATLSKGLHITLGTRPNCLLRLKELVSGAGSGKGLSSFQQARTSSDDSSDGEDNADKSDEPSSDNGFIDGAEEDEADALTPEAEMVDVDIAADETETFGGEGVGLAMTEEGAESVDHDVDDVDTEEGHGVNVSEEEANFVDFTNEEEDDTGGVSLKGTGEPDLPREERTSSPSGNDRFEQQDKHDELNSAEDAEAPSHRHDSELLDDFDHAGGLPGQEQDDPVLHLEPDNGLGPIDQAHQHGDLQSLGEDNEDDFLDLSGDFDNVPLPTALSEDTSYHNVASDDVEVSLGTSATLDHDEIDYEDRDITAIIGPESGEDAHMSTEASHLQNNDAPAPVAPADPGLDEIDWDDEDKNGATSETASTPATATGKRTRKEEGLEDYLIDDLPDLKRHRIEQSPV